MAEPATVSAREERILGIIETARGKRPKFRDERITMAHGAGGKATQSLIEGLFLPALGDGALGELAAKEIMRLTFMSARPSLWSGAAGTTIAAMAARPTMR